MSYSSTLCFTSSHLLIMIINGCLLHYTQLTPLNSFKTTFKISGNKSYKRHRPLLYGQWFQHKNENLDAFKTKIFTKIAQNKRKMLFEWTSIHSLLFLFSLNGLNMFVAYINEPTKEINRQFNFKLVCLNIFYLHLIKNQMHKQEK